MKFKKSGGDVSSKNTKINKLRNTLFNLNLSSKSIYNLSRVIKYGGVL